METIILPFYTWYFEFFLYLSLTFLPISQNPSYLGMFWKFPCPSQVGYQNICTIKEMTSKVTAEDGSVPLVVSVIPGIRKVFFNLLNWYKTLCSVTGDPGQPMVHHSHPCHPSRQVSQSFQLSFVSQSQSHPSDQSHHCYAFDPGHRSQLSHLSHPSNHSHPRLVMLIDISHEPQSSLVVQINYPSHPSHSVILVIQVIQVTIFATNTITSIVNVVNLNKSSKLKNYTARQNRKRLNYDQSLLDDRLHGFELSRSADRHNY